MIKENSISFQFLAEPTDVNFGGNVHGGAVMKWIDQVSFACATNWSGTYCVTIYVGGIRFHQPIKIGDLVKLDARVIYTGRTSMHIMVDVMRKNIRCQNKFAKTTHCIIVFVAVNKEGLPVEIPVWKPATLYDIKLETYAKKLMDMRKDIEQEMSLFTDS